MVDVWIKAGPNAGIVIALLARSKINPNVTFKEEQLHKVLLCGRGETFDVWSGSRSGPILLHDIMIKLVESGLLKKVDGDQYAVTPELQQWAQSIGGNIGVATDVLDALAAQFNFKVTF